MYIIKDWAGNVMFRGKTFPDYETGWEFIYCNVDDADNAYDDLFVVEA